MSTYMDGSALLNDSIESFSYDSFENFIISDADIESKQFTECKFKNVLFVKCTFHDVRFITCTFNNNTFKNCTFTSCIFDETCLFCTMFLNCVISGVTSEHRRGFGIVYEPVSFINGTTFGGYSSFFRCSFLKGALFKDCKLMSYDVTLLVQDCTFHKFCIDEHTIDFLAPFIQQNCPSHGSFIGWKCVRGRYNGLAIPLIAKLYIPANAKRVNGCGSERKCRCSRAKILEYYRAEDMKPVCPDYVVSGYNRKFEYPGVGEYVVPDSFNDSVFVECGNGIHFFLTLEDALAYSPM